MIDTIEVEKNMNSGRMALFCSMKFY